MAEETVDDCARILGACDFDVGVARRTRTMVIGPRRRRSGP
ncbi:hypothetical protein [Chthonobacter rhizosphaerae]|nr:hypothetical protein [Chthonobacter rhizosphaerae]